MPNNITITTEANAEQPIVLTKVKGEDNNIYSTANPLDTTGKTPKKITSITTGDPKININDNGAILTVNNLEV